MMTFDQNTYTIFLKNSDPSINFMPIFKSTGFCMTVYLPAYSHAWAQLQFRDMWSLV